MSIHLTRSRAALVFSVVSLLAVSETGLAQRQSIVLKRNTLVLRHPRRVLDLAFAPDGKVLASTNGDQAVMLWDPATGRLVRTLPTPARAGSVAFSPDGTGLTASLSGGAVTQWNTQTWIATTIPPIPPIGGGPGLAYGLIPAKAAAAASMLSSKPRTLLAAWYGGQASVFEVKGAATASAPTYVLNCSDTPTDPMDPYYPQMQRVEFAPNGLTLATVCDHLVTTWDAATGARQQIIPVPFVADAAFSRDGRSLAIVRHAGGGAQVQVRNLISGVDDILAPSGGGYHSVAFSPDGSTLATAEWQTGNIVLWNVATRAMIRTLTGHSGYVRRLAFSPDGSLLASGGGPDSTVRLWQTR